METVRVQAAVLHADVQGYSLHMGQDEAGTFRRVMVAIELFRRLIGDFGGTVVDAAGDSILATFLEPAAALRFAIAFQADWACNEFCEEGAAPLRFRIGLHLGEVRSASGVVYGQAVNIAARLQGLAPAGGICASQDLRSAVAAEPSIPWRPLGPARLRNIDLPVMAFTLAPQANAPAVTGGSVPDLPLPSTEPSIVILPFSTESVDCCDRHLADGTVGDVIAALTRFRDLAVIAGHSAFQFRGTQAPAMHIARCLGVRYAATGTLQRQANRLRLTVRLEETATGGVLWAERFDGQPADIFAFQEEVAAAIAARLAVTVRRAETRRLTGDHEPVLGAYSLVLRGQALSLHFRREANLHARRLLEAATQLDAAYGRAYAALSRTYNYDWRYAWASQPDEALEQAVKLARDAVERDDADARGYAELGYAHLYRKEHDAALAAYERAVELNPNEADILVEYADALAYCEEAERAVGLIKRAMRLNPLYPDWYLWYLADAYDSLGRSEEVIATVRRMRNPDEGRRVLAAIPFT